MARRNKMNADYFPHEVQMRNDRKIKPIRTEFGNEGYAIYCMILETIAEANLLMIEYNDQELMIMAGDFGISSNRLKEMIDYFLKLNLIQNENGYLKCKQLEDRLNVVFERRKVSLKQLRLSLFNNNNTNLNNSIVKYSIGNTTSDTISTNINTTSDTISTNINDINVELIKKNKARPKSAKEVTDYAKSIGFNLNGQKFIDHYEAVGWKYGKSQIPIKDWKACVRTWKNRETKEEPKRIKGTDRQPVWMALGYNSEKEYIEDYKQ